MIWKVTRYELVIRRQGFPAHTWTKVFRRDVIFVKFEKRIVVFCLYNAEVAVRESYPEEHDQSIISLLSSSSSLPQWLCTISAKLIEKTQELFIK